MYHQAVISGWNAPGAGSSGISWNGGGVISAAESSVVSRYDSSSNSKNAYYPQLQQSVSNQQQQQQHNSSLNNVSLYTQYYHGWKAIADSGSSTPSQKEWARYYADLSSHAAHYYHQNPNTSQPPPYELPPSPPGLTAPPTSIAVTPTMATPGVTSSVSSSVVARGSPASVHCAPAGSTCVPSAHIAVASPSDVGAPASGVNPKPVPMDPKSFQVYVDRCLQQCKTPHEKKSMMQSTKTVLQKAILDGNLRTKDWSSEPLLAVLQQPALQDSVLTNTSNSFDASTGSQLDRAGTNQYGPGNKTTPPKYSSKITEKAHLAKKRTYPGFPDTQDRSYYGPSDSSFLSVSPTGSSNKFPKTSGFNTSNDTLSKRAQRFASSVQQSASFDDSSEDASQSGPVVVGTCQVLEKEYLRLTSAPKPELVRPQPVLEKHFGNLQREYADPKHRHDYLWFCSQLKSIRQDCTVQHLKNEFCVQVYEFHAKVALEQDDMNEFNQCQTQLKYLYPALKDSVSLPNRAEFLSYRILYAVYMNIHSEKATIDMKDILRSEDNIGEPAVQHAKDVLCAALGGNYHAFFSRLYPSKYGHQNYFLEKMVPLLRKRAVECMCAAYRPTLEVDFVCEALQLSDSAWLEQVGCVLECSSTEHGQNVVIKTKESQITGPEDTVTTSKLM